MVSFSYVPFSLLHPELTPRGLIGPARLFSKGGIYNPQLWMLLVGAVLPVPFWYWSKKHPESIFRHVNPAIVFAICLSIPPATGINLISFLVVGFTFQFWIRRYRFAWWSRYNYVLSAGLDVGTLASGIFIFLCLRLPNAYINWWGNNVYQNSELALSPTHHPPPTLHSHLSSGKERRAES